MDSFNSCSHSCPPELSPELPIGGLFSQAAMGVAVTELWTVGELDLVDDLVFTETISRFLFTTGGNLGFVFVFLSLTVVFVVILTVSTFLAAFSDNFFWCRKRVTFCSS